MSQETILIAALSGRALAAAARRAGFTPLVVDAFGDADMREGAGAYHCLSEATRLGFRARPLLAALDRLAAQAARQPVGLVLGSGFEDTPKLVATLAKRYRLIGNDGAAIARAKDPAVFFPLLDRLAVGHPETRLGAPDDPPDDPQGWLSKRIGGSGGAHVMDCRAAPSSRGRYVQRRLDGVPVSLLAVARRSSVHVVGFSRQWTVGTGRRPYRYGGATGPVGLEAAVEARMTAAAEAICDALGLIGVVSFDFLLREATPLLLEVNPRPGATLDIFDDASGALFAAHIAACCGGEMVAPEPAPGARAAGVLYADIATITAGALPWPSWTADRPSAGTRIPLNRPIATVFAAGETATTAEYNCRHRLDELAHMLYGRAADTELNNAKVRRPRPERVGASGQAR